MKATQTQRQQSIESTSEIPVEPSEFESEPEQLPLDVVFEILKNRRRRLVLQYLDEVDAQTSLSDLAEHIAAIENDKTTMELGSQERKRVYVGLYQCHLPRMHDSGAISFDDDRGTVEIGPNAEQLYEFLEEDVETENPWSSYYLAYTGASAAALTGAVVAFQAAITPILAVAFLGFSAIAVANWAIESS